MTSTGHRSELLIITDAPGESPPQVVAALEVGELSQAPQPRVIAISELVDDPSPLDSGVAVWICLTERTPLQSPAVFEVTGLIHERHLTALLTHPGCDEPLGADYSEGVTVCPPATPPAVASAMLATMLSQRPVIAAARQEIRLLHAHQGGLADQIGKIDEELRLAAKLQREFLPANMPHLDHASFHTLWRPAGYVSGDIYDVFKLDEHHVGFFIADAVGHGVPAALMTMYIKRSLLPKIIDSDEPRGYRLATPAEALTQLNHSMCEQQTGDVRFATAAYAVLDTRTMSLCVARAGHPYPMLLRGENEVHMLRPEGGLLGVFPEEEFEQACVQLEGGDRLLLYSDGFEVAFPDHSKEGSVANARYEHEFLDLRHGHAEQALAELSEKVDAQAGSLNQQDDLTVVCLTLAPNATAKTTENKGANSDQANPASLSSAMLTG